MIALLLLGLGAPPGASETATVSVRWVSAIVEGRGALPSLRAVQQAAVETLALADVEHVASWPSRARWRGTLPRLEVSLGTDADLAIRDSFSASTTRVTTEGRTLGVRVAARWELGEVLLGELELRGSREAVSRAAAVRLAIDDVTRLYFQRVEVLAAERSGGATPALIIRAALLDGLLRGYTGGRLDGRPAGEELDVE